MTPEPDQPTPAPGAIDPLDDTQPIEASRFAPAPDHRPDTRWAWATPGPGSPSWGGSPEAAQAASSYGIAQRSASWSAPSSAATASFDAAGALGSSPSAAPPPSAWTAPRPTGAHPRSGAGVGTVAAVALLSAILASGSTVLALSASGTFDARPTPATGQAVAPLTTAGGQAGAVDESAAVIASSARISPSVVKITTGGSIDPLGGSQSDGVGSGIIYDANGWILTNHHVVSGTDTLTVQTKDGQTFQGTVYGIDTLTDLAIVKVDATGLPAAAMGSSDGLKVGQLVVAVGSPLGTYSFSVTSGIVSGKGRSVVTTGGSTISNLIQTDAAINAGNAGGPLADADGNVVGINTVFADGSNGIGFAIPIDIAKPIMAQAVKGEKLERPWIGIRYLAIDQKVKAAQKLSVDSGALVSNVGTTGGSAVQPNSPAEAAGIKDGDVITAINGTAIDQEHPLNLLLVQFEPGDTVQLTVVRDEKTLTIPVTLGVRPANLQ